MKPNGENNIAKTPQDLFDEIAVKIMIWLNLTT